jgi:integrase
MRHAAGFDLVNAEYLLRSFAREAAERSETHVRAATAIEWASRGPSVAQRDARLKTICRFARYVRSEDARHEIPPARHFGAHQIRRVPHIYSRAEITRLIDAAEQLSPPDGLHRQTYATLIALLAATGLRISEALFLRLTDVTPYGLVIRKTKFQKTRLVPLHETTQAGLDRYLTDRRHVISTGEHVFVTDDGRPLRYREVYPTFQRLVQCAGLVGVSGGRLRLHELRHTFAVRALEASPSGRQRIGQHMVALATYMGHVNIDATYWYLETTPDLLREIATASEAFVNGGQL